MLRTRTAWFSRKTRRLSRLCWNPSSTRPRGELLLELSDAWKSFGHVIALLRAAHLHAYRGEILALVGDNGAGKSTLLKVFSGLYALDKGSVKVNGVAMDRADPRRALRLGVSTVFQDLALVETLDVATNMYLGQPIVRGGLFINHRAMVEGAALTLRDLKVRMPSVRIPVGELSGGRAPVGHDRTRCSA